MLRFELKGKRILILYRFNFSKFDKLKTFYLHNTFRSENWSSNVNSFGMTIKDRSWKDTSFNYRFGFNGQEGDDEVNGSGNSYAFRYRIHDPRLGRFLSADPLEYDYPWNSPYSFAENGVIEGLELEGLEKMKSIEKFEYDNTWMDYVTAVDNAVINVVNIVPSLWNSAMSNYESIKSGTWVEQTSSELNQIGTAIGNQAKYEFNYVKNISPMQFGQDALEYYSSPKFVEQAASFYIGSQIGKLKVPKKTSVNATTTRSQGSNMAQKASTVRPSAVASEAHVGKSLSSTYKPQASYLNGKPVKYGTKGSARPEYYNPVTKHSIEVKNYNISTSQGRSSLVSNVKAQANYRKYALPEGSHQSIHIDVRGQNFTDDILQNIESRILSGVEDGVSIDVQFIVK